MQFSGEAAFLLAQSSSDWLGPRASRLKGAAGAKSFRSSCDFQFRAFGHSDADSRAPSNSLEQFRALDALLDKAL